jgi:hypothetical protein
MGDPTEKESAAPTRADVCDQIGRNVSSLWERRSGVRPASVTTEYVGDVVRCQIHENDVSPEADGDEREERDDSINLHGYQIQAAAAVERVTRRTVKALIAKHEKAPATNAFILEPVRTKH